MSVAGFAGSFVVVGAILVCSLIDGFNTVGFAAVIVFFILAALGEIVEYLSGIYGAKRYGASNRGVVGAMIGGLVGAMLLSGIVIGVGTVIGVLVGTFSGAFIGEYFAGKNMVLSGRAGWGALLGKIAAIGFKVCVILIMTTITLLKYTEIM
jgi:uncharacterized protein YqgC (DUF456 family)